jgi:hypothetical protein
VRYLPLAELLTQEKAGELEAAHIAALSEMERDVIAQRHDRKAIADELLQFSRDLQGGLYAKIHETALASIEILQGKSGKSMKSGTTKIPIQRIRTMLEMVNESLFWPDERLTEQMRRLNALVPDKTSEATDQDKAEIEHALARLAIESRMLLQSIEWTAEIRSGHHVGIPDDVVELKETRRARPRMVAPEVPAENIEGLGAVRRRRPVAV